MKMIHPEKANQKLSQSPDYDKASIAIVRLKNNKVAELFKHDDEELSKHGRIWSNESLPDYRSSNVLCPINKKGPALITKGYSSLILQIKSFRAFCVKDSSPLDLISVALVLLSQLLTRYFLFLPYLYDCVS